MESHNTSHQPLCHRLITHLLGGLVLVLCSQATRADLIMTAPPRESVENGEKIYTPIATYLSTVLGEKVTYQHPRNWLFYQRDMRAGKYDIVFDGPHFMSWRMKNLGHEPVAKLPGKLAFYIVTKKDHPSIKKVRHLVSRKVCGIAPPNLSTLTMFAELNNPARQPVLQPVRGGMPGVYKAFREGKCEAAIFRDKFYQRKLKDEDRADLVIIFKSKKLPNQGITVSDKVSPELRAKIAKGLTQDPDGIAATELLRKRFAAKAKAMVPAKSEEYKDSVYLLEGVIFGW